MEFGLVCKQEILLAVLWMFPPKTKRAHGKGCSQGPEAALEESHVVPEV